MDRKLSARLRNILAWVAVVLGLAGIIYVWGDDILYYATGQDIADSLDAELMAHPTPRLPFELPTYPAPDETAVPADSEDMPEYPDTLRRHVFKYVVQPGDVLTLIAEKFNLHPDTIFWANSESLQDDADFLRAGMELYILPVNGVYHRSDGRETITGIASRYGVDPAAILTSEFNDLAAYTAGYVPPEGLRIVVPGGQRDYTSYQSPVQSGDGSGDTAGEPEHPGSCPPVEIAVTPAESFIDPLVAQPHRVITEFARWHPGVDIAAPVGSRVYSAEAGIVVFAGWHHDGYGNLVIIDHGGGWTTYYAHLDEVTVRCGQRLGRAEPVGYVGMTGNASVVHVHFEMRLDGQPQDPRPGACRQSYYFNGSPDSFINPLGSTPYLVTSELDEWHAGIDMAAVRGTPIYASARGVVIYAGWNRNGYGELIIIDHGDGWTTYYGHLAGRSVGCGDIVSQGQVIGEMGMTGNATGVHLHFELHDGDSPLDPRDFFTIRDRTEG